jgi:hypothetical protein
MPATGRIARGILTGMRVAPTTGYLLDRRWHWLRGEMERSKEPDLATLIAILSEVEIPYAVIGGIALQIHQPDPRTTIDIDVAVARRADIPRERLGAAGFRETGVHEHSVNWLGPEGTPVQFTDDPALVEAVSRAVEVRIGELELRVIRAEDLLHEKLRAGRDPARRRSKRIQDLADAQALVEQYPELLRELAPDERRLLDELPG